MIYSCYLGCTLSMRAGYQQMDMLLMTLPRQVSVEMVASATHLSVTVTLLFIWLGRDVSGYSSYP